MVAKAQRLPVVAGERINIAAATAVIRKHLRGRRRAARRAALTRIIRAFEPWYNWGTVSVERMQGMHIGADGYLTSDAEGDVRFYELQWFGAHLEVRIGRTPKAVR